jgi:hypothetical protein
MLCQLPPLLAFILCEYLDITSTNSLSAAFPGALSLRMPYLYTDISSRNAVLYASLDVPLLDMLHLSIYLSLANRMCCLCISRDTSSRKKNAFVYLEPYPLRMLCLWLLPDVLITSVMFISLTRKLCVCVSLLSLRVVCSIRAVTVNCMRCFLRFCQ